MKNIVLLGFLSSILFLGCSLKKNEIIEQEKKINLEKNREEIQLKKKFDEEVLINSEKTLKAEEIKSYIIDENTPLILKNQSKDRAYE